VWQFDAVVAQVDCRAAQSKTQSTFPPALTKAQSTFPLDWQHRQDIANCRVGRKNGHSARKSMHSEKIKGRSKDSGCILQLASLSAGNATVVDCCAAKKYMRRQRPRPNKNTKKAGCSKKYLSTVAVAK